MVKSKLRGMGGFNQIAEEIIIPYSATLLEKLVDDGFTTD